MYSWKNKFKFGKSKEEKEAKHSSGLFHHDNGKNNNNNPGGASDASRKETITDDTPSFIAPTRSSRDASSAATATSSDELSQFSGSGPDVNDQVNQHADFASQQQQAVSNTSTSTGGVMTIKVYNGDGFSLPFPITANNQILAKLLNSGAAQNEGQQAQHHHHSSSESHAVNVDQLISQLSHVTINNQGPGDESLIPDEVSSKFIPATILLPGSNKLNPLLYFTIEFDNTVATIEPEYGTMAVSYTHLTLPTN